MVTLLAFLAKNYFLNDVMHARGTVTILYSRRKSYQIYAKAIFGATSHTILFHEEQVVYSNTNTAMIITIGRGRVIKYLSFENSNGHYCLGKVCY
jgi:hypothetical protein